MRTTTTRSKKRSFLVQMRVTRVSKIPVVLRVEKCGRTLRGGKARVGVGGCVIALRRTMTSQTADDVNDETDDYQGADGEKDEEGALPPDPITYKKCTAFNSEKYFTEQNSTPVLN